MDDIQKGRNTAVGIGERMSQVAISQRLRKTPGRVKLPRSLNERKIILALHTKTLFEAAIHLKRF
jgi:hypothetical protein